MIPSISKKIDKMGDILYQAQKKKILSSTACCKECNKSIPSDRLFVYIDSETLIAKDICSNCLKVATSSGKVLFYDTAEFYAKRVKSGFISKLIKEHVNERSEKGS